MEDLWTTRCTRCPAALDALNQFATKASNHDGSDDFDPTSIQCISICCGDTLDGAREIIETSKLPRWDAILHYFMAYQDKERCKQLLKFRQVPFYVVFDSKGTLLYSGSQKLDWQTLFQESSNRRMSAGEHPTLDTKNITLTESSAPSPTSTISTVPVIQHREQEGENSAFVIDDMDF